MQTNATNATDFPYNPRLSIESPIFHIILNIFKFYIQDYCIICRNIVLYAGFIVLYLGLLYYIHIFVLYLRYCIIFNLLYYMLILLLYLNYCIVVILFYYTYIFVLYLIFVLYFMKLLSSVDLRVNATSI